MEAENFKIMFSGFMIVSSFVLIGKHENEKNKKDTI